MAGVNKQMNEYAAVIRDVYDEIPKAVFAALAVSYALRQVEDDFGRVRTEILGEWAVLHANGIVPQRPPKGSLEQWEGSVD